MGPKLLPGQTKKLKLPQTLSGDLLKVYVLNHLLQGRVPTDVYQIDEDIVNELKLKVRDEQSEAHSKLITKESIEKWVCSQQANRDRPETETLALVAKKAQDKAKRRRHKTKKAQLGQHK
jgi:hypothetical protein